MTIHNQALQVSTVRSNGYFKEPISKVRILDHYHTFLFYLNLDSLENSYTFLEESANNLRKNITDSLSAHIYGQIIANNEQIKQILDKINHNRNKRALASILGKTIRFITGNLDEDDLKVINENLDRLYKNQNAEIDKINHLNSIANHLSQRYAEDIRILNRNIKLTEKLLRNMSDLADFRNLLRNTVYQTENLLSMLMIIERTITFSLRKIPNLEMIRIEEMLKIYSYLKTVYSSKQLLPLGNIHSFEILQSVKLIVF